MCEDGRIEEQREERGRRNRGRESKTKCVVREKKYKEREKRKEN